MSWAYFLIYMGEFNKAEQLLHEKGSRVMFSLEPP